MSKGNPKITLRLEPAMLAWVQAQAALEGLEPASWLREGIRQGMAGEEVAPPSPVALVVPPSKAEVVPPVPKPPPQDLLAYHRSLSPEQRDRALEARLAKVAAAKAEEERLAKVRADKPVQIGVRRFKKTLDTGSQA